MGTAKSGPKKDFPWVQVLKIVTGFILAMTALLVKN